MANPVKAAGARPVCCDPLLELKVRPRMLHHFTGVDMVRLRHASVDQAAAYVPLLEDAFADDRPDVIVHDGVVSPWSGRVLAARLGIPAVESWPTFASNQCWSLEDEYIPPVSRVNPRLLALHARLRWLLRRQHVPMSLSDFLAGRDAPLRLAYFPREFQFAGETFDESFSFVGPCFDKRYFQGGWRPARQGRRAIVVTLSTGMFDWPEFFQACIQAFVGMPHHVVISVGDKQVSDLGLGGVPPNITLRPNVPLLRVLPHADLFITSGGMGSVMESLFFGVPMLVIPQLPENHAVADRVSELGLGRQFPAAGIGARPLREAAEAVIGDDRIRAGIEDMQRTVRAAGGAVAAADGIDRVLKLHA
jgi:MGT family glycosyltransferase